MILGVIIRLMSVSGRDERRKVAPGLWGVNATAELSKPHVMMRQSAEWLESCLVKLNILSSVLAEVITQNLQVYKYMS